MEYVSWVIANFKFVLLYVVNAIAGDNSDAHYPSKEKNITEWTDEEPKE